MQRVWIDTCVCQRMLIPCRQCFSGRIELSCLGGPSPTIGHTLLLLIVSFTSSRPASFGYMRDLQFQVIADNLTHIYRWQRHFTGGPDTSDRSTSGSVLWLAHCWLRLEGSQTCTGRGHRHALMTLDISLTTCRT
jgi:hypothetical protein